MSSHIYNTQKLSLEDATKSILEKKQSSLVDYSLVGRWLFLALKKQERVYVVSCRLFKEVKQNEWKIEWFPSDAPPPYYNCPEKILSLINPLDGAAKTWVQACRDVKQGNAKNREQTKAKLTLLQCESAKDVVLKLDVGDFIFKGFYMNSKTEIIIKSVEDNSLKRLKLSLLSLEQINNGLNDKGLNDVK